jgi:hypothetical protein
MLAAHAAVAGAATDSDKAHATSRAGIGGLMMLPWATTLSTVVAQKPFPEDCRTSQHDPYRQSVIFSTWPTGRVSWCLWRALS